MRRVAKTDEGRSWLTNLFRLCNPLTEDTVNEFISFVSSALDSMAMTDYPNPASFLQPMPAYPIKVSTYWNNNISLTIVFKNQFFNRLHVHT